MGSFIQIGVKLVYSGILAGGVYLFASEIYRVWFDRTLVLSPFSSLKDGVESKELGQSFTRRFSHDLTRLQRLYTGRIYSATDASIPTTDQLGRGRQLDIPVSTPGVLADIEVEAYGIQVTDILRRLSRAVRRPYEITGNISQRNKEFEVYSEILNSRSDEGTAAHWYLPVNTDMDDLSRNLACRVLLELAAEQSPQIFGKTDGGILVTAEEFCGFLQGLESYQRYREFLSDVSGTERAEEELVKAKRIVDGLLTQQLRLPFSRKLAAFVLNDAGKKDIALSQINDYISMLSITGHTDASVLDLQKSLLVESGRVRAAMNSSKQGRVRPIHPGASISSESGGMGSITGIVSDSSGEHFILTAAHVLQGELNSSVIQPAAYVGGDSTDKVGTLTKVFEPIPNDLSTAVALIKLEDGVDAVNSLNDKGQILAPTGSLPIAGSKLFVVSRDGIKEAEVKDTNFSLFINTGSNTAKGTRVEGTVMTSKASVPGDSGAPVITQDNELFGFVFAGSASTTIIMPIAPILKSLNVEWVDANVELDSGAL